MSEDIKAIDTIVNELRKIREKYEKRAEREREKVSNVYVTVKGEKCYTEDDINAWYQCDYITSSQCDKIIEKLEEKQKKAGQEGGKTPSENVLKMLNNTIDSYYNELADLRHREEQERKKQERWEIAQAQGCSYAEWLEQEEVSRQSEEYEKIMGGNNNV